MIGPLVETDWLESQLGAEDLRLLDGSWYLPAMGRNARSEYAQGHIPGAVFFDIDAISDPFSPLPHMLPPPESFAAAVGALGIGDGDRIVVYDGAGLFSAARVWWMFRAMGARNVAVLNGGLGIWKAERRPLDTRPPAPAPKTFTPHPRPDWVRDLRAVKSLIDDGSACIVDARPQDRFSGAAPEPRPGLRSGHMPASRNTPIEMFLLSNGRLKPPAELVAAFEEAGVDLAQPIVTTCGSGITAAIPFLALTVLGKRDVALYDGSWAQWGGLADATVEKG
ncbi:3-mercaptopyruvate sulfurtransferase [hydrothermal vent metagenome]|uniref:3-mercaptopyruvate sulfurtransferase n=1 Tax=hydrothermal vent metagenome TaxID=652676 RepID=A0A3B0TR17_9ZZZZ